MRVIDWIILICIMLTIVGVTFLVAWLKAREDSQVWRWENKRKNG
jgi:hypothetical protein